jgi:hypothetical protein
MFSTRSALPSPFTRHSTSSGCVVSGSTRRTTHPTRWPLVTTPARRVTCAAVTPTAPRVCARWAAAGATTWTTPYRGCVCLATSATRMSVRLDEWSFSYLIRYSVIWTNNNKIKYSSLKQRKRVTGFRIVLRFIQWTFNIYSIWATYI